MTLDRTPTAGEPLKLLVVGAGRMGSLVEKLAPAHGFVVAGVLDLPDNENGTGLSPERCRGADVAIEFTTPTAVIDNVRALAAARLNAVIGTTGWRVHETSVRSMVAQAGIGVVVAANFSLGANVLEAVAAHTAALLRGRADYDAWVHEHHHAAKKDAPSGTALSMLDAVRSADPDRRVDVSSTRAGYAPGTHTIGFDGPAEQIGLTHLVRDRAAFAHGALVAARWIAGRAGWFTMRDVLGLPADVGATDPGLGARG
jgi:4-hydroxy-tetrahydrodipicolinate reductase